MTHSQLHGSNLNLLNVLRSILNHRSVTKAAEELNVTQAAVSNSLRKLREHFADDLLVRDGRGLRLTPKADQLVGPLNEAISALHKILEIQSFDPAQSRQRFRIATASSMVATISGAVSKILATEAPHVTLQFVTATARSSQDLHTDKIELILAPRQIALAASLEPTRSEEPVSVEHLFSEPFVCVVNSANDEFRDGITNEQYLAHPHASFYLDLDLHASLEHGYIQEHRLDQFDRMLTSDFSLLPLLAASSDCIALVPRSLAKMASQILPIRIHPCPLPIPHIDMLSIWNRRRDDDPEIQWLRSLLRRCVVGYDRPC